MPTTVRQPAAKLLFRFAGSGGGAIVAAIGRPQFGHVLAAVDMSFPQSGHVINGIDFRSNENKLSDRRQDRTGPR
jgi:hypothetical protein